jgi:methylase of polypeptide subunit release factors
MVEKKDPRDTQFKKGVSGNPGGKAKEQRANEIKAAEIAAKMRLKILASMQARFKSDELTDQDYEMLLSTGALKLFKDSEDRAFGSPQQHVDNTSTDGTMTPTKIIRELVLPKKPKP